MPTWTQSNSATVSSCLRAERIDKLEEIGEIDGAAAVEVEAGVGAAVGVGKEEEVDEIGPAVTVEIGWRVWLSKRRYGIDGRTRGPRRNQ